MPTVLTSTVPDDMTSLPSSVVAPASLYVDPNSRVNEESPTKVITGAVFTTPQQLEFNF